MSIGVNENIIIDSSYGFIIIDTEYYFQLVNFSDEVNFESYIISSFTLYIKYYVLCLYKIRV